MFPWKCNKESEDSEKLARENVDLQRRLNQYEHELAKYKKRVEGEFASASFSVDWKSINAFSIERNTDSNNMPKTIIGFMLSEPVVFTDGSGTEKDIVREWTLYCSHAEHERLVADFNKTILGK